MPNNTGHFVRFLQRVRTSATDLGARAYLYLDSGFTIYDRPDDDAIGIAFNPAGLYQTPWKFQVEGRATSNVNIASPSTIGGVALVDELRYGLFGQSDPKQNGIYRYDSDSNTLIRTSDADESTDILGAVVMCRKGTGAGEMWYCSNTGTAVPGIDNLTFVLRQAAGDKAKLDGIAVGAQAVTWPNIVSAATVAAVDIDLNGIEVKNAKDPTTAQSLVTRQYYEDHLPSGGVTDVVGTAPIGVTGTTTKTVSISAASGVAAGSMSSSDYTKLAGIESGAQVCSWSNIVSAAAAASTDIGINGHTISDISGLINSSGDIRCTPKSDSNLVAQKDALATAYTSCIVARNATAATNVATVQNGPVVASEGRGWRTSSGGASLTVRGGFVTVPVSGATVATRVYTVYDSGTGSYSAGDYYTDSDPYLFGTARVVGTVIFTLSGFRDAVDGNGGIRKNGSNMQLTSGGSNEVQLATNSTVRQAITSTGAITYSKNTSAVTRVQHGTAGVNYTDLTGTAVTVTASGTGTLYTIATVSNSYVDVEVRGFAYHVGTPGNVQAFGVRCAFKNIAGTVTDGTRENIRTPDNLGTAWGTPPTVTLAHSGTDILATGAAAGATDTRFIITEVKWSVGTTSA